MNPLRYIGKKPVIFLLRHGEARLDGVKRFVGQLDVPLTGRGRKQAEAWARWFSSIPLVRVVASDLRRTRDTARIIAAGGELTLELDPRLREIDLGEWEGKSIEEVKTRNPKQYALRGKDLAGYHPPAGESFADVQRRVVPVFIRLVEKLQGNLLIVSHAGVNRTILCHLLGMPLENLFRLSQDYGALNIIEPQEGRYRLHTLNLTAESLWMGK